jgi:alpha-glucosidase
LIVEAGRRHVRVLLDLVPNYTSDQHPWFHDLAKRTWYVWRDPKPDGSPPNNWQAVFGGSAWTFDENGGQYYLHKFLPEQPDLDGCRSATVRGTSSRSAKIPTRS